MDDLPHMLPRGGGGEQPRPLDDPCYVPAHPPINDRVPVMITRWGPRSQVRWFRRFADEVGSQPVAVWDAHYCASERHRGQCCGSCGDDFLNGYAGDLEGRCCCYDGREGMKP